MGIEKIRKSMNFRELGGYPAEGGRRVKYGMFYRCGALGDLNEEERVIVDGLGIAGVYDFRSTSERKAKPDYVPEGAVYYPVPAMKETDEDAPASDGNLSPEAMEERMIGMLLQPGSDAMFREFIYGELAFSPSYQKMFDDLKQGKAPIVFHCSAGKDRTGIAAILILLALGVDYETAMEDYLRTNAYRFEKMEALKRRAASVLEEHPELEEQLMDFEGVRRVNAEHSFLRVKERCGTIRKYFEEQFGLDEEGLERLREMYTER